LEGAYFGGVILNLSDRSSVVKRCDNTHTVKLKIMNAEKIGLKAGRFISIAIGGGVGIFYLIKDVIL